MTPTLRKLYHRRGRHLECIAEIDKKIAAYNRSLVCYDDGVFFEIGILDGNTISANGLTILTSNPSPHITILEKGFER